MDYVGIDLHKRESQICVHFAKGGMKEKRIKTSRDRFATELAAMVAPGSKVLLEASTESMWAAKHLASLGYQVIVADPNFAPMYGDKRKRKVKTDRRDALALADACKAGNYRVAHQSSEEAHRRRNLLTTRGQMVAMRTKCIVTTRSLLRQHGYSLTKGESETFAGRVRALVLDELVNAALLPLLTMLDALNEQLKDVDDRIAALAEQDPHVKNLMSVPGVGPVTAVAFQAILEDASRFKNGHKAAAYVGLVPGEDSSGDGTRRTGITKTGSSLMRWLLVQAALTIMRTGKTTAPALYTWAHAIGQRRGKKVARVALARRLAGILFALLRDGRRFDASRFAPTLALQEPSS